MKQSIENYNSLINQKGYIIYNGNKETEIFLDFGKVFTKLFKIEYFSSADAILNVSYGPTKDFINYSYQINLKQGQNHFSTNKYIVCRYLKLEVFSNSSSNPVICEIKNIVFTDSQLNVKYLGEFSCDTNSINDIWNKGAYTAELCLQRNSEACAQKLFQLSSESINFLDAWEGYDDNYVIFDGPRRDREAWLGDIRTEALVLYSAFGEYKTVKNSLKLFFDLQKEEGWTYGSATTWQEFTEYNLWFIIAIWEYCLYSGDIDFLKEEYFKIKKLWNYLLSKLNENYFIHSDASWMWTFPREGFSSAVQCILYKALEDGEKISSLMNDSELASKLLEIKLVLREKINEFYWDEEKGVYIENLGFTETDTPVFLDVNSYAVVFDIADDNKKTRILKYLKDNMWTTYGSATIDKKIEKAKLSDNLKTYAFKQLLADSENLEKDLISAIYPHNRQVWPFMNGYETEARFISGDENSAIELMQLCWGNSNYNETGTFWEMFDIYSKKFAHRPFSLYDSSDNFNSECHGWSGWVSFLIQKYLLGVYPIEVGFKKVLIEPHPGKLKSIHGIVPTTHGNIFVNIEFANNKCIIKTVYPSKIDIIVSTKSTAFAGFDVEIKNITYNSDYEFENLIKN